MTTYTLMLAMLLSSMFAVAPQQKTDNKVEEDIREAVLRYMFEHSAPQQMPHTKVLFVSIDKKEPSKELLSRFANNSPPVKSESNSDRTKDMGLVVDKKSGESGILFSVGAIKRVNNSEAIVAGSYYVAWLFAGGCEYRVVFTEGKWVVKGCSGKCWMS